MKNFKADEMEMAINFKAMRLAWMFLELALAVYCAVVLVIYDNLPATIFVILCASGIIFFVSKLMITKKMTANGDNDEE
ncbi:MAG: hypothetical protein NC124_13030 [Clostridium sp.]|nr:hypothetical protein [Clostridium sp.]